LRKSEVEDSSSSKYVPPDRRHIKGKDNIVCKNANYICAKKVKQYSNKTSLPTTSVRHYRSHPTQMSTSPGSEVEGSEGVARHSTSDSTSGFTALAAVCSCQSEGQIKEERIKVLQEKAAKAH